MESTITEKPIIPVSSGSQAAGPGTGDRYVIFSGGITAGIEPEKDGNWIYSVSFQRLSRREKEILTSVETKIQEEKSLLLELDSLKTLEEYRHLVLDLVPTLSGNEEIKIVSRLFTGTDPLRWIPVILTDPWISQVLLPLEGGQIRVHHEKIQAVLSTGIVLTPKDLDRFESLYERFPEMLDTVTRPFCRKDYSTPLVISHNPDGPAGSFITIKKPQEMSVLKNKPPAHLAVRDQNDEIQPAFPMNHYRLLSDTITVSIVPAVMYEISLAELSEEETCIYRLITDDLTAGDCSAEDGEKKQDMYRKTCQYLLKKHARGIDKNQKLLLLAWLLVRDDPVQMIRTILLDPAVRAIECLAPGIPVSVRHSSSVHSIPTNLIPDRDGLEKIASYFLQSSGISPDSKKPVQVRFRTGETLSITRISLQDGDYPRISIIKSNNRKIKTPLLIPDSVPDVPFKNAPENEADRSQNPDLMEHSVPSPADPPEISFPSESIPDAPSKPDPIEHSVPTPADPPEISFPSESIPDAPSKPDTLEDSVPSPADPPEISFPSEEIPDSPLKPDTLEVSVPSPADPPEISIPSEEIPDSPLKPDTLEDSVPSPADPPEITFPSEEIPDAPLKPDTLEDSVPSSAYPPDDPFFSATTPGISSESGFMDTPGISFSDPVLDNEHKKRIEQILTVIFSQQPGTSKIGQMQKDVPDPVDTGLSDIPDTGFMERITGLISGKTHKILPSKKKAGNKKGAGQKTVFNTGFSSKGPLSADSGIGKVLTAFTGVFHTVLSHFPDKHFFEDLIGSLLGKKIKIVSSKKKAVSPGRWETQVMADKHPSTDFLSAPVDAELKQTGSTDARVSDIPETDF